MWLAGTFPRDSFALCARADWRSLLCYCGPWLSAFLLRRSCGRLFSLSSSSIAKAVWWRAEFVLRVYFCGPPPACTHMLNGVLNRLQGFGTRCEWAPWERYTKITLLKARPFTNFLADPIPKISAPTKTHKLIHSCGFCHGSWICISMKNAFAFKHVGEIHAVYYLWRKCLKIQSRGNKTVKRERFSLKMIKRDFYFSTWCIQIIKLVKQTNSSGSQVWAKKCQSSFPKYS